MRVSVLYYGGGVYTIFGDLSPDLVNLAEFIRKSPSLWRLSSVRSASCRRMTLVYKTLKQEKTVIYQINTY